MKRGDFYLVKKGKGDPKDPKRQRIWVVVSWQPLLDSNFPTVVCAQATTKGIPDLPSQVRVDESDGFKHPSTILCDALYSIEKSVLTDFKGCLSNEKMRQLDRALAVALGLK